MLKRRVGESERAFEVRTGRIVDVEIGGEHANLEVPAWREKGGLPAVEIREA